MARILLATPPWLYFHTLQVLFPNLPPLGLQIVGAVLKKRGHKVLISDVQHLPPLSGKLISDIENFKPDIIGFTISEIATAPSLIKQVKALKERYPDIKYLAGGHAPTFFPELFLGKGKPFDAIALHEAEETAGAIVESLIKEDFNENVPAMAWIGNHGEIKYSKLIHIMPDLNKASFPFVEGTLKKASFSKGYFTGIEASRGCPFNCTFCSIPGFYGKKPRYKSVERIIAEIEFLRSKGVTEIAFIDDSFATKADLAREVFSQMIRRKLGMNFGVQIRADIIAYNPQLIDLAKKAGMIMAIVGFEGYTKKIHDVSGKGNSAEINREASKILRKQNIAVYGTHIFGVPGNSWRDDFTTFFKGRRNSDVFRMTIFTPVPGSSSYEELKKSKKINTENPLDFYEGKYVLADGRNPFLMQLAYFCLLALHYVLPDTLLKMLDSNEVIRAFMRRAYRGAFLFVFGVLRKAVSGKAAG